MGFPLTKAVLKRIDREFQESDREAVIGQLEHFVAYGSESPVQVAKPAGLWRRFVRWLEHRHRARVHRAILNLSKGDIAAVRFYMKHANEDWRDVLLWGEYGHEPPRRSNGVPLAD